MGAPCSPPRAHRRAPSSGLQRGRHRVCEGEPRPLRAEHRQHRPRVPRDLQVRPLLASRKSVMGNYVLGKRTSIVAVAATLLIVALNLVLIGQALPWGFGPSGTQGAAAPRLNDLSRRREPASSTPGVTSR